MIRFGPDICRDFSAATSRQWLETNGLGGFSSSTIAGINTRCYHGLLTAATKPPGGRYVLLSKLEETLVINGDRHDLSANQYPGVVHPRGFELLTEFRLDPFPVFTYQLGELIIEKSIFMVQSENTTVIQYKVANASDDCRLEIRPLIAFRDFHSTTHENGTINGHVEFADGLATITPYAGLPSLHLAHNAVATDRANDWYRNFEYEEERRRGLDFREDLFHPLTLTFNLSRDSIAVLIAGTQVHDPSQAGELERDERARRETLIASSPLQDDFVQTLTVAADQFIAQRGSLKTIMAGYHWFGDWGRDTMIALPGLTLVTGRHPIARNILIEFSKNVSQGMLPNRFPDDGDTPEYNSVDSTLWYFEAIRAYVEYTGDFALVREELYPILNDIIDWHVRGTRYRINIDPTDGLLHAGEPGVQLTWMDAKIGDWVVTPRTGKPVEIQALWFNALCIMENFARHFGEDQRANQFLSMATKAANSFNQQFWNAEGKYLHDVIENGIPDPTLRPNQVIATSLHHSMLSSDRARSALAKIEAELLTPFGLRTLSPAHPKYIGHCGGDAFARDSAYHQGTVWPWLLGPFITGYVRFFGKNRDTIGKITNWLVPFRDHLAQAGLGTISEIFCADSPFSPCGCIAQAWSVGEILRAVVENIHNIRPLQLPYNRGKVASHRG